MEEPLLRSSHGRAAEEVDSISRQRGMVSCGDGCGLSDPEDLAKRRATTRKLVIAIGLCIVFMILEVGGGIIAGSLAILTDAAHLLSDVASFAISLFAIYASGWDATPKQSYGFHRVEILGALVSIHIIWLITGILVYEAVSRFFHDSQPVNGGLMFIIATLGLLVNIGMMLILGDHGHGHSHGHSHSHGHGHSHSGGGHSHQSHSHTHSGGCTTVGDKDKDHNHADSDHDHQQHDHEEHGRDHDHQEQDHGHQEHGHQGQEQHDHHGRKSDSFLIRVDSDHGPNRIKLDKDLDELRDHGTSKNSKTSSINVRGAYLHVLGDLIQSIGVMIAGAIIWYKPEWKVVDLVCTLLFSVLVLLTTVNMWTEISDVLMESTPREIDATRLEEGLRRIGSVQAVHELHIWAITLGKVLLACHVKIERDADADEVLRNVIEYCERDFKITHVTIQIERD
ncbi:metal tolerance protein A1 [Selaginella moellendorffii]|nr:metal tolerance protein A1 [Selaginella moellendorffii]|eukprot:XP_002985073.2 metal tolerance protein A1 [Selaginella moellendorffii]